MDSLSQTYMLIILLVSVVALYSMGYLDHLLDCLGLKLFKAPPSITLALFDPEKFNVDVATNDSPGS